MPESTHPPTSSASVPNEAARAAHPSRLEATKTNLAFLAKGNNAAVKPNSIATRSVLTTFRYVIRYVLRRAFRVALYGVAGTAVAFVSIGVIGSLGSGLAFFAAPSLTTSMLIGVGWSAVKFGWRHRPDRFRGGWWSEMERRAKEGRNPASDEADDAAAEEHRVKEENKRVRQDVWMRV